jgi:hypothetical protein
MKNYKLNIGLNDKITLKQEIATEKAITLIKNKMESLKKGFSLKTQVGGYLMEDNQYTFENSLELSIFEISKVEMFKICDYFKQEFNQESILITEITEQAIFY